MRIKRRFLAGFLTGALLALALGFVAINEYVRLQYAMNMLSVGSNMHAAIAADLELGRIDSAQRRNRLVAWVEYQNLHYAKCAYEIRWHLFTSRPDRVCGLSFRSSMPEDWQIPGMEKARENAQKSLEGKP